jgi:hypothetical protein
MYNTSEAGTPGDIGLTHSSHVQNSINEPVNAGTAMLPVRGAFTHLLVINYIGNKPQLA